MITFYKIDNQRLFSSIVEIDETAPLPEGTTTPPPKLTGDEVAFWSGRRWTVLPERPILIEALALVPQQVTMRQARLALLGAGVLEAVEVAFETLDEEAKAAAKIEWEYATVVERNAEWVIKMGDALDLTPEQLDSLFISASKL